MPTVFTHPAPLSALAVMLGGRLLSGRMLLFGVLCSVLPDADVLGFKFGISYAHIVGHRGFSHSLLFALIMGLLGVGLAPFLRGGRLTGFCTGFFAVASHILLDAMTSGGLGVAAFWPLDPARHFCEWRPIRVSPFSPRALFSQWGLEVLHSEVRWVWLPCVLGGGAVRRLRKMWARRRFRCSSPFRSSSSAGKGIAGGLERGTAFPGRPKKIPPVLRGGR